MKSDVTGVAGSVRNDHLTLADLANAEKHGKRQDKTGQARSINSLPPLTTTGLELRAQYDAHVRNAFIPKGKSKVIHMLVQFPVELVDAEQPEFMLHHARTFAESVFGPDAIFGDRLDRDEKSRHVVDLFITPKYTKRTKHQEKFAVSMTRDLKLLQKKFNHPAGPQGNGRALQDAWYEYLRDRMGLEEVKRGQPKIRPGADWKSAEELRARELENEKERLRNLAAALEGESAQISKKEAQADKNLEMATAKLTEAERYEAVLADTQSVVQSQLDHAQAQALAAEQTFRDAQLAALTAQHAREQAERAIMESRAEQMRANAAREHAIRDRAEADAAVLFARRARAEAEKLADTVDRQKNLLELEQQLQNQQFELLTRAAVEKNGLDLRPGRHPNADVGFVMNEAAMTREEHKAYLSPWTAVARAFGQRLAAFLASARALFNSLQERERLLVSREATLAEKETKAQQELEAQRLYMAELDARSTRLNQLERAAAVAMRRAIAKEAEAKAMLAEAEENVHVHERWNRALKMIDTTPGMIVVSASGQASLDLEVAKSLGEEFKKTIASPIPAWAASALGDKLDLADKLHLVKASEGKSAAAAKELEAMISRLGPVMNPSQKTASNEIRAAIQRWNGMSDRGV
jgi:hypothetical protein